jgi:hypothetical protein
MEDKHASSTSSFSSPYKQRMFRSISNNYRNYKNIQYFGSNSNSLDHNSKQNTYSENGGGGGHNKEVHKQANNNVNSDIINDDNLISYEHLSETSSSWIDLVLPVTIFTITIIAVIFIAFILFAWIRKTLREDNYRRCVTKKASAQDDDKEKILEERLKCSSSKRCEKTKNSSKSQNKMNSRKWLREKTKQIDNSVVSDDVEQKLETIEYKSTPPTSPNSQKEQKVKEDDEEPGEDQIMHDEEEKPKTEILHEIVKTNPFACPMTISDISVVTSVIQPQQSW